MDSVRLNKIDSKCLRPLSGVLATKRLPCNREVTAGPSEAIPNQKGVYTPFAFAEVRGYLLFLVSCARVLRPIRRNPGPIWAISQYERVEVALR